MSQWKLVANAAGNTTGPVQTFAYQISQGSGKANRAANNISFANGTNSDTPGAALAHGSPENIAIGQYAFTPAAYANGTGDFKKVPGGPGWVVRRAFEGPILTVVAANGTPFANGETVLISGGSSNAVISLVANATGNLASGTILNPGLFPNTSGMTITFNRERHVEGLYIGANTAAFTNLPAANAPVTVTVSNTGNSFAVGSGGVTAVGVFVSNIATGITNTRLNTITWTGANTPPFANGTGFWGLFSNNQTNTAVVIVFTNANGQVIANGTPSSLAANLIPSTGGNVHATLLGGRAGRVQYETLVSTKYIANGGTANSTNSSVYFPQ